MMNPATGQSEAITINLPKSTIENLQLAGGNLALGEDGVTMLQGDYNQLLDIVLKNSNLQVGTLLPWNFDPFNFRPKIRGPEKVY